MLAIRPITAIALFRAARIARVVCTMGGSRAIRTIHIRKHGTTKLTTSMLSTLQQPSAPCVSRGGGGILVGTTSSIAENKKFGSKW
jgi:hypothetical protein